jgi:hypothetical protein
MSRSSITPAPKSEPYFAFDSRAAAARLNPDEDFILETDLAEPLPMGDANDKAGALFFVEPLPMGDANDKAGALFFERTTRREARESVHQRKTRRR